MSHGIIFLIAGIAMICVGMGLRNIAGFFPISLGIAFLGVGVSFVTGSPRYFFKRRDGRLSLLSYLLFWPYHLLNWISLAGWRLMSKEAAFDEIVPGLFLGSRLGGSDGLRLQQRGVVSVLDLTCEFSEERCLRQAPAYLCIPLLDRSRPTGAELEQGIAFIRERIKAGPVYVHCAMGHGRSATFVIGYLLAAGIEKDLDRAIDRVRSMRPRIKLHPGQLEVLKERTHERGNL
jgi:protein-tyrosine phosphatase